ncbi:molybdate-binding protein [Cellulomonas chitinilytica]|uniref:Molybdate-binding protein n=1 Tax=Cellulomonas chitinilytica TaxID=398759 RepID=A0A919PA87_9CELL|nr:molybdate ABC transporter substrate-binding protein [Cellulomonas chitinilytica]GIG23729.1 molybdate-binding protein [Cellulomonas chitinilytica]
MRRLALTLVAAVVGVGLAGCGSGASDTDASPSSTPSASPTSTLEGDITVLAAASLTESFTTLGEEFEKANPGVKVTFSFAASSALAGQITDGAPADVFASASTKTMDEVVAAGDASDPVVFATNSMEIAVPPANPGKVTGLDDLTDAAIKTALCQAEVPCGSTAAKVFTNAGITVTPVTLEPDVKAVLSKVTLGEVDAGVVYMTDVIAAGADVQGVKIPDDVNASTDYPIATLSHSSHADVARAFVDYVLSSAGADVLSAAGFARP